MHTLMVSFPVAAEDVYRRLMQEPSGTRSGLIVQCLAEHFDLEGGSTLALLNLVRQEVAELRELIIKAGVQPPATSPLKPQEDEATRSALLGLGVGGPQK